MPPTFLGRVITSPVVAGHGPGSDKLIGTGDDPTGQNCNWSNSANCASGPLPFVGTYTYSNLDYQLVYSCGLGTAGPCKCSTGESCTKDADCPSGCGTGDCCPGLAKCEACPDQAISFFDGASPHGAMETCQEYTNNNFIVKSYDVLTSESIAGTGGGCVLLNPGGGPYVGTFSAACPTGGVTGSMDVDVYVGGCPSAIKFTIRNISYNGNIVNYATASSVSCNLNGSRSYSGTNWTNLKNAASATCGSQGFLQLICGTTTLPASPVPCFEGAVVEFVNVLCTSDPDRSTCNDNDCS